MSILSARAAIAASRFGDVGAHVRELPADLGGRDGEAYLELISREG